MSQNNSSSTKNSNSNTSNNNKESRLCCFGYVDYIVLASTLAVALGEELNTSDLNILSTFLAVLSDELALIASVESCSSTDSDDVFVPPVPDVAMTKIGNNSSKSKKNKTRIKRVIKKKIKKK